MCGVRFARLRASPETIASAPEAGTHPLSSAVESGRLKPSPKEPGVPPVSIPPTGGGLTTYVAEAELETPTLAAATAAAYVAGAAAPGDVSWSVAVPVAP